MHFLSPRLNPNLSSNNYWSIKIVPVIGFGMIGTCLERHLNTPSHINRHGLISLKNVTNQLAVAILTQPPLVATNIIKKRPLTYFTPSSSITAIPKRKPWAQKVNAPKTPYATICMKLLKDVSISKNQKIHIIITSGYRT